MNKLISTEMLFVTALFSISAVTITCPVILTNDTDKMVHVITNDTEIPELNLEPGKEGKFGNHANHIEFTLEKEDANGKFIPIVSVKQLACAKRLVLFTVNSLLNHTFSDGQQIHAASFEITKPAHSESKSTIAPK